MSRHSDLVEKARVAIDAIHRDTSVSQATTRCDFRDLRDHIDMLLDGLDDSDELEDEE